MQEVDDILQWLSDERLPQELGEPQAVVVIESAQTGQALRAQVISNTSADAVSAPKRAPDPSEDPADRQVALQWMCN